MQVSQRNLFISNDLVQLGLDSLLRYDLGANVPVSRNVIGTRVGKENFVGIPWS